MDLSQYKSRKLFKNAVKIVKSQKGKRKRDFSYNKEIKTIRSDNILFKNSQMERGIDPNYNYIRESIKPETPNSPHFPCSIKLLSSDHLFTTINAKNQSVTKLPEKINEMGAPIHNKYLDCNLTITNIPPKSPKIKIVFDKNGGRNSPEQNHDIEEQPENILSTTINKTGAAIHKEYLDGDLRNTKILPKLTKKKIVFDKNSERNLQNNYIAEQPQNVEERTYVTFIVNKKLVQKEITEKNNCKLQNSPRKEQRNFRLLNSPRGTTENIFEESHLNIQENQLKCCENEPNLRKEATSPLIIHNNVQRESALGFSNASDLRLDQETSEDSFESDQMYSKKITHTLKFGAPAKRPPCRQILVAEKNKKWPSKSMSENKVSQNDPVLRGIVKLNVEPEKVGSCNIQRQVGLSCGDKRTPVAPDKFSGDSTSFKMPFLPSTLPKYSPKT